MVDYEQIISAVTTVGFPVVMCLAMAIYIKYISDKNRETIQSLNDHYRETVQELTTQHNNENKMLSEALNNNTLALQKLTDKLGVE